jgi:tetratricopeptide (TPR) repeat protein
MFNNDNLDLNKLLILAKQNHQKNNFEEAFKIYKKILDTDPNHFETTYFLAILNTQIKKYEQAKELLEKAILIKPEMPELYNSLGLIHRNIGNFEQSLKSFKKAIQILPEFAVAYNNMAIVYRDLDNVKEAEKNLLYSIKIDPNNSDPYNNLGLIYRDSNQENKAKEFFEKSLEINPKNLQTLNNLGNLHKNLGQIDQAEKYFYEAININFKFFDSYINLSVMYERINLNEKLEEIINKANKIFPSNIIIKLFHGQYLYKIKKFSEAIECLNQISFAENQLNRERLRYFILAKCYEKLGNIDNSFDFFKKTNEINAKQKKDDIDKKQTLKIITERINFFKKEKIDSWSLNNSNKINFDPFFLIGFPRSGTTLLDTILRSHPSIELIEEKPLIKELIISMDKEIAGDLNNLKYLSQKQIEILQNQYLQNIKKYTEGNISSKIIIDKMPLNIIHVGEIIKIFPNAKFILSLRHPCDAVLSCFMQNFKLNSAMANFLDIESAAHMYDCVMKLWIQYINLFSVNSHIVKYENVINNFDSTIKNTLNFLNLPWSENVKKFYETADKRKLIATPSYDQVNQPIYPDSVNKWKKYNNKITNILPILQPWIKEFKYDD